MPGAHVIVARRSAPAATKTGVPESTSYWYPLRSLHSGPGGGENVNDPVTPTPPTGRGVEGQVARAEAGVQDLVEPAAFRRRAAPGRCLADRPGPPQFDRAFGAVGGTRLVHEHRAAHGVRAGELGQVERGVQP